MCTIVIKMILSSFYKKQIENLNRYYNKILKIKKAINNTLSIQFYFILVTFSFIMIISQEASQFK